MSESDTQDTSIRWPSRSALAVLLFTLAASFFAYHENNDFPLGYHADEDSKVRMAIKHEYLFRHPIVLVRSLEFAAWVSGATDEQRLVELGRTISAGYGTLYVLACFLLFRLLTTDRTALLGTIAAACTPLIVIHAHYLKEDIYFIPFFVLSLAALIRYLNAPSTGAALAMSVAAGLTASAKYVGSVVTVFFIIVPFFIEMENRKQYFRRLFLLVIPVALLIFVAINTSLLFDPKNFAGGLLAETRHASSGHRIDIYPWADVFYHLRRNLIPSMGWGLPIAGLLGALMLRWSKARPSRGERILLAAGVLYYILIELSPLKPHPDSMRYTMPLAPILAYFAVRLCTLPERLAPRFRHATPILVAALLAYPVYDSWNLVAHLPRDTRAVIQERFGGDRPDVFGDAYAMSEKTGESVIRASLSELRQSSTKYIVVSSFNYERYFYGESIPFQTASVHANAKRYHALFEHCPYEEITPDYRTFAFSNPTIRIVRFDQCDPGMEWPDVESRR